MVCNGLDVRPAASSAGVFGSGYVSITRATAAANSAAVRTRLPFAADRERRIDPWTSAGDRSTDLPALTSDAADCTSVARSSTRRRTRSSSGACISVSNELRR